MEEETRKRGGSDDETAVKRPRNQKVLAADPDDDIVAWLSLDDETMDELMKFLDADGASSSSSSNTAAGSSRVKFIENPYSSQLIFQSSCSYITINGNEESCGSSFSDWESSVMASIDMGGIVNNAGKASGSGEFCEWFEGGKGGALTE